MFGVCYVVVFCFKVRMPRKLRLGVYRKNQYRKKQALMQQALKQQAQCRKNAALKQQVLHHLKLSDGNCALCVSVPIALYYLSGVRTIMTLQERIKKSSVLPSGTYYTILK